MAAEPVAIIAAWSDGAQAAKLQSSGIFFVAAVVLLFILPSPWNFVGFGTCFVVGFGEALFWNHTVRGREAEVGAETLIGSEARVFSPCRPVGQVQVEGEIWEARCDEGADPGATVRVVSRDGLTLVVEQVSTSF